MFIVGKHSAIIQMFFELDSKEYCHDENFPVEIDSTRLKCVISFILTRSLNADNVADLLINNFTYTCTCYSPKHSESSHKYGVPLCQLLYHHDQLKSVNEISLLTKQINI